MTRPPPNPNHAVHVLAWMTIALIVYFILTSCSGRPGRYDASLEPPDLHLDHCAKALTYNGETVMLCSSSRKACRFAVGLARRYGRSWMITDTRLKLGSVSDCLPAIHEQKVELK